jgi:nucleotide-binding universal stress UspA family protein
MSWKTVTTFVTDRALDLPALRSAGELAQQMDAALDVLCLGIDLTQPEVYYTGAHAMALPGSMEEASRQAQEMEAVVRDSLAPSELRWSVASAATPAVGIQATVADAARFSDVVVAGLPYGAGRDGAAVQVLEAALFGAPVPVLVVPGDMPKRFARVMIAWNESPEGLRAVRATMPVLAKAEKVEIVLVDPPRHGPDRSDPGGRLAQMLSRHGVHADVRILSRSLPTTAEVLSRHIADSAADMVVMGAYGHSRLREAILGGATRDMLENAKVPVLMAH